MKIYLIVINVITFIFYVLDKYYAIKDKYRISEYTLLSLSIFGGSFGALLGMYWFHHKTKKTKFILINLISLIIWCSLLIYL